MARRGGVLAAAFLLALVPVVAAPGHAVALDVAESTTLDTPAFAPISADVSVDDVWLPIEREPGDVTEGLGDAELLPEAGVRVADADLDLEGGGEDVAVADLAEPVTDVDADVQAEPAAAALTPSVTIAASLVLATAIVVLSVLARRWRVTR